MWVYFGATSTWYKCAQIQPACPAVYFCVFPVHFHWVTQAPNQLKPEKQTSAFNRTRARLSLFQTTSFYSPVESLLIPDSLPWLPAHWTKVHIYFLTIVYAAYMTAGRSGISFMSPSPPVGEFLLPQDSIHTHLGSWVLAEGSCEGTKEPHPTYCMQEISEFLEGCMSHFILEFPRLGK